MKKFAVAFIILLLVIPAVAQGFYSNGPTNGNTDAWTINFGFIVSDRFTNPGNGSTVTGGTFAMWVFPGDTVTSAELSITSLENGGNTYFDQTVSFTQSGCVLNQYSFNVCNESTIFSGPTLNTGTYWINLQNASVPSGDPVYWDENSGGAHAWPPGASDNTVGTIPAESFTLFGSCDGRDCAATPAPADPTVPEPASILLLGPGVAGLAAWLRRKQF